MQSFVLTRDELVVIRAAVRFWREENGDDWELLQFYSGVPDACGLTSSELSDLGDKLQCSGLRYLICRQPEVLPTTDHMYRSADKATSDATGQDEIVVTVLVAEPQ